MATLSTLSTLNLNQSKPPAPKTNISVDDVWRNYFAGKHNEVMQDSSQALFTGNAPDFLHICGLSMLAKGRVVDGIAMLKVALLLYPMAPSWFANAAIASLNAGAVEESLAFAELGLSRHDDPVLHFTHGNALMQMSKLDEASQAFMRALKIKPDMNDARLNLGNVLRRVGRTDEALSLYNQVLARDSSNGLAMINRAGTLIELNEHDEAAMLLLRIMATSEMPEVTFMMAMIRMIEGELKDGFDLYRSRFDCMMAAADKAQFRKPLISSLAQAKVNHLLVSHEQGFGDSLQFIRYLPMLVNVSQKVTLLCPKTLHRLFSQVDNRVTIVENRDEVVGGYDLECPMLHMPFLFETTLENIPASIPYLTVPADLIEQNKLKDSPNTTKKVGLVWAGQMRPNPDLAAVDRRRSLSYSHFEPLLEIENVDFVSLQLGDPAEQIFSQGTKGIRRPHVVLRDDMDFMESAAIIMNLDLVITVDTAIAHLAAGLGKPTWVLSRFDQCWRWMKNREDSPWYPGVLRLFHQETRGDWTKTLADLKTALQDWAK